MPATSTSPASYLYPAGSDLYFATIDPLGYGPFHPFQPGCTTTVVTVSFPQPGPLSCTGPENDQMADWPAFTTDGPPVAGPGVAQELLGVVYRPDLQTWQVTYAGHALYLFDPVPNSLMGANFFESVSPLPPWHTAWYLLHPDGTPAPGSAPMETATPQPGSTYTSPVLATEMLPNVIPGVPPAPPGAAVAVYTFSGDDDPGTSECYDACARLFSPVYTDGPATPVPGVAGSGVNRSALGVIRRWGGSRQVTYNGHPLYLYSQEQPLPGTMGPSTTGTGGNGNGIHAFGGTFKLVTP